MRAPQFWWRPQAGILARLLSPLASIYGAIVLRRMRRAGLDVGVPVICVGNFVAGGAGKTPTAIALTTLLKEAGHQPVLLTRGYGGTLPGPIVVDPARHSPSEVGDEALLLARHGQTVVARDRPRGAALARSLGATTIVMDDGLQNSALTKSLAIAVVDGASGVGNGLCHPAGPLRAPLDGQMGLVDLVIVIGEGAAGDAVAALAEARGVKAIAARLIPAVEVVEQLRGVPVIAVAGIGRPDKFSATLRNAGARILAEHSFPDHHAYTTGDVAELAAQARAHAALIATTEKDWVKLESLWPATDRDRIIVVPVTLALDDPAALSAALAVSDAARPAQA